MTIFKCKMCGGDLEIQPGISVAECPYCGTKQTLPKLDDDRRANLYDRANHFRRNNEYDKAMGIYEQILNEDKTDAEAYWSLVLCRYGIEYVEDPTSHKRIPTVNRAQYTSVFMDEDYKSAIANADEHQKAVYNQEAKAIDEIQKGILAISQQEEPFDVFICYKETDNNGRRTPDSVLANDLYHELTNEGFKVFFSRITLEDKLGTIYEPYIFAALNSAKVMVVLGTKPEYFNAVWVKNEWSRYLALIKNGAKRILIPAYKEMDPYDLPEEFSHLQAQDMSKLGFMQDLIRGIKKLTAKAQPSAQQKAADSISTPANEPDTAPLLKRAFMFLEDGDWSSANDYCEKVLDKEPENAMAYVGKLMAELQCRHRTDLLKCEAPLEESNYYLKALRFADADLRKELENDNSFIKKHIEDEIQQRQEEKKAEEKNTIYSMAAKYAETESVAEQKKAAEKFGEISDWRDAASRAAVCRQRVEELKKEEELRITKDKKTLKILLPALVACIAIAVVAVKVIIPSANYSKAMKLIDAEDYERAHAILVNLGDYKDAEEQAQESTYLQAIKLIEEGNYERAYTLLIDLGNYKDCARILMQIQLKNCQVGDKVTFGTYQQNVNNIEAIEWIVLARESDKVLLISKDCLDIMPYHDFGYVTIWEQCTLRTWLNQYFINEAFSPDEQALILPTNLVNTDNSSSKAEGENNTTDQVFLLSIDEAREYLMPETTGRALATDYAVTRGAKNSETGSFWLLRSPGSYDKCVSGVSDKGEIRGGFIPGVPNAVRPAMWIKIE